MAVELEKIAELLTSAHSKIEGLEKDNLEKSARIIALEEDLSLSKIATDESTEWGGNVFGEVSNTSSDHTKNGESALDSFLND